MIWIYFYDWKHEIREMSTFSRVSLLSIGCSHSCSKRTGLLQLRSKWYHNSITSIIGDNVDINLPSVLWETVYCRHTPTPQSCIYAHGFDKKWSNTPIDNFQVKISEYGVNSWRGVYTTNDLVKGTYVSLETVVHRVYVNALSTYTISPFIINLCETRCILFWIFLYDSI